MGIFRYLKKVILIVTPLVVASALGWYFGADHPYFAISDHSVEIELEPRHESLLTLIKPDIEKKMADMKGQNIWKIHLAQKKKELESLPWVRQVSLQRRFPDRIATEIFLEEVLFHYADSKNRFFPVLRSGVVLKEHALRWLPGAPVLRNKKIFKNHEKRLQLAQLFKQIPSIGPLQWDNISSVDQKELSGLEVSLIQENVIVHLGVEDIETKALQVLRVLDYLKSQKQKARVIDASFSKKVLVRLRKGS